MRTATPSSQAVNALLKLREFILGGADSPPPVPGSTDSLELAQLGSSERIQRLALEAGLVLPQPGDVRYLRAHRQDAGRALRVMTAPNPSGAAAAALCVFQHQSCP